MHYLATSTPAFVTLELGALFALPLLVSSQTAALILALMVSPIAAIFAPVFPGRG